eukprot:COSAG06_NODE_63366_length_262_cov_0.957055_1_plen_37_part_01
MTIFHWSRYIAIGGLVVGPLVWLASMASACVDDPASP